MPPFFAEAIDSHMNKESQGSFHKALDLELPISIGPAKRILPWDQL